MINLSQAVGALWIGGALARVYAISVSGSKLKVRRALSRTAGEVMLSRHFAVNPRLREGSKETGIWRRILDSNGQVEIPEPGNALVRVSAWEDIVPTISEKKAEDEKFFSAVTREPLIEGIQRKEIFEVRVEKRPHNMVLVIYKQAWILPETLVKDWTKHVHFEAARKRNEFRLDVVLHPYEGSIEKKPELLHKIKTVLTVKATILAGLRAKILDSDSPEICKLNPTDTHLLLPEKRVLALQ